MVIIGIDPGTATTGYGVVRKIEIPTRRQEFLDRRRIPQQKPKTKSNFRCLGYGAIRTSPAQAPSERLKKLNNELSKLIKEYRPKVLAVEDIYFFKNLKTVIPVSQAKGVILLTAAKNKIPVFQFTPLEIKLAVAGFGRAEKGLIQKKIKQEFKLKEIPKPDDAADALAVALTYFLKETS